MNSADVKLSWLVDNALSPVVAQRLLAAGFDAVHVLEYGLGAASDDELLVRAEMERRVVLSADADFGTLLSARASSLPSVLLLRGRVSRQPDDQVELILANLPTFEEQLASGALVVIEPGRIRVRLLPLGRRK